MVSSTDELPKQTGQYMFLEFKDSYDYCLLPSYSDDEGRMMVFPSKPAFIDQFKWFHQISKVDLISLWF